MYYTQIAYWPEDKRKVFLEWLESEGLDPNEIADDGKFSVYRGRISGNKFVSNGTGGRVVFNQRMVKTHFSQPQKNPMPEELGESE